MTIKVSPVQQSDWTDWQGLWLAYCDFYKASVPEAQTALTWRRILDPDHTVNSFIARNADGTALGIVTYLMHPSTWIDVGDCYLEDLYVSEKSRGLGVGRSLIMAVKQAAQQAGCERLYWNTNVGNTTARKLYDALTGGEDGHVRYRMTL
ncbi:MAG: GNAT family N-acetyltransferase [Alphaproteobacteria bacterium]|nr:GNAT family N-acetyltransferase [Alphaproteobacteria bacterium]